MVVRYFTNYQVAGAFTTNFKKTPITVSIPEQAEVNNGASSVLLSSH